MTCQVISIDFTLLSTLISELICEESSSVQVKLRVYPKYYQMQSCRFHSRYVCSKTGTQSVDLTHARHIYYLSG